MLLRVFASGAVFLLFVILVIVGMIAWLDDFTLYSTRDGWVNNALSLGVFVGVFLSSILISVVYFRYYSLANLRYQPYANAAFVFLAALALFQIEFMEDIESVPVVEIIVLPNEFKIQGQSGKDVVTMLKSVMPPESSGDKQIILSASSEVGYIRLQDTLSRLHDAGYRDIGLSK